MDYLANYNSSLGVRLLTFTWVFNKYIALMFLPFNLHMAYEVVPITSFFSSTVFLFLIFISLFFFFIIKNIKKRKMLSFSLLWFLIILLPRTNILKINRPLYEHWLYLPLAGFFFFVIYAIYLLIEKIKKERIKKITKLLAIILFIFFTIFLSFLTVERNKDWQNPITFYEKNLKYTPHSFIQKNNLGMAYAEKNENEKAIEQYTRAIAISDVFPQIHYNLANSLLALNNPNKAIKEYNKAIEISPTFVQPHLSLLNIYLRENKKEETLSILEKLEKNVSLEYYFRTALPIFLNFKEYDKALEISQKILLKYPDNKDLQLLLLKLQTENN
jgi:tetratricopeptide (TPR) repeat protein